MWVMCLIDSDTVPTGILGIMVSGVIFSAVPLVGVLLKVYTKDVHVDHVSLIDSDTVPTGILGIMVKLCHFVSCTVSWCSIDSVHQRCTCGSCVSHRF